MIICKKFKKANWVITENMPILKPLDKVLTQSKNRIFWLVSCLQNRKTFKFCSAHTRDVKQCLIDLTFYRIRVLLGFEMSSSNMDRGLRYTIFSSLSLHSYRVFYFSSNNMSISGFSEFEFIENPNRRAQIQSNSSFKG